MPLTLDHLRRYAIARSLFKPTTLKRAIGKLGFVQADPIRAPARAQDLTLRHRVLDYHAGDLERRYPKLEVEEDFFVNYGFLPRQYHALMHPRASGHKWPAGHLRRAKSVLAFVRERGIVHPREVDAHFAHGKATNWFGGSSNVSTQLLDAMHYRGMIRVARREGGTRVYAVREAMPAHELSIEARLDLLVDIIVRKYAPLPATTLSNLVYRLRGAAPQWQKQRRAAFARAKLRLAHAQVAGVEWYWPAEERAASPRWRTDERVRILAPFDPIVWDRRRFEIFWDWAYRFEAYVPAPKRKLGYYALPILWQERIVGWANLSLQGGCLKSNFGYIDRAAPQSPQFQQALAEEEHRFRVFLSGEPAAG